MGVEEAVERTVFSSEGLWPVVTIMPTTKMYILFYGM
jgi:hypothetical protein